MKTRLETKSGENKKLREEVMKVAEEMVRMRDSQPVRKVARSLDHMQQTSRSEARQVPPSDGRRRKLFVEVLKDETDKRYKITLKGKDNCKSPEQIKLQLMDINPTDIKVGIKTLKTLWDGRIIIETGSEEEINSLSSAIITKCGEEPEIIKHKLRKPRLIIYNVSEEIRIENAATIIKAQNPEIKLNGEDIVAKFRYKTRKGNYNTVIEVGPQNRKQILQTKLRLGWEIYNVKDYFVPTRCYRCSHFNQKHNDCKGEVICTHCAGNDILKECTAPSR
jgi:hypothetical protein